MDWPAAPCCPLCCPPSLPQPGVLIGWRTVLSAAHCVGGFRSYSKELFLKRGFVRVGGTKLSTGRVAKVRTAAACDPATRALALGQRGCGAGCSTELSQTARRSSCSSFTAYDWQSSHLVFVHNALSPTAPPPPCCFCPFCSYAPGTHLLTPPLPLQIKRVIVHPAGNRFTGAPNHWPVDLVIIHLAKAVGPPKRGKPKDVALAALAKPGQMRMGRQASFAGTCGPPTTRVCVPGSGRPGSGGGPRRQPRTLRVWVGWLIPKR